MQMFTLNLQMFLDIQKLQDQYKKLNLDKTDNWNVVSAPRPIQS